MSKSEKARKLLISEETVSLQEFNEKLQELYSVRAELERVRKDKNIISGLVNQTQRDMSSKVSVLCRYFGKQNADSVTKRQNDMSSKVGGFCN